MCVCVCFNDDVSECVHVCIHVHVTITINMCVIGK